MASHDMADGDSRENVPRSDAQSNQRHSGYRSGMVSGILLGIFIAVLSWFGWAQLRHFFGSGFNLNQPVVVSQIRELKRLETVVFTVDKVVAGERTGLLPPILTGDRILLVVRGEVFAGVDFGKLNSGAVSVAGRSLSIKLPPAEIFSTRIDNGKTQVFSRETGLLTPADPNLESDVLRQAEKDIQAAAIDDGILRTANQNANVSVTSMLLALGFEQVEIK